MLGSYWIHVKIHIRLKTFCIRERSSVLVCSLPPRKPQDGTEETDQEEGETSVEKVIADEKGITNLSRLYQHNDVVEDLRKIGFLLGGISMALLAVRCIAHPLLEAATGLTLIDGIIILIPSLLISDTRLVCCMTTL